MANGVILWEGPSSWDGAPVVVVLTWHSQNRKTGAECTRSGPGRCKHGAACMAQTWILRADMHPVEAIASRDDASICGDCVHRGDPLTGAERSCYVTVRQGPSSVWRAYSAGSYPRMDPVEAGVLLARYGRGVRLGAYGDPGVVPVEVWRPLVAGARMHTGYTHRWRELPGEWAGFLMASGDTVEDRREARLAGWRTYFVAPSGVDQVPGAIECLSDSKGVACIDCGACAGTRGRSTVAVDVWIRAHGTGAAHVDARHRDTTVHVG